MWWAGFLLYGHIQVFSESGPQHASISPAYLGRRAGVPWLHLIVFNFMLHSSGDLTANDWAFQDRHCHVSSLLLQPPHTRAFPTRCIHPLGFGMDI